MRLCALSFSALLSIDLGEVGDLSGEHAEELWTLMAAVEALGLYLDPVCHWNRRVSEDVVKPSNFLWSLQSAYSPPARKLLLRSSP